MVAGLWGLLHWPSGDGSRRWTGGTTDPRGRRQRRLPADRGDAACATGLRAAGDRPGRPAAIEAASRHCPDGVLLDVNLPDGDGFAVARALAAVCPAVRIVLTSADVEDVPAAQLARCHAAAFVPKDELAVVDLTRWFGQDEAKASNNFIETGFSSALCSGCHCKASAKAGASGTLNAST